MIKGLVERLRQKVPKVNPIREPNPIEINREK